MHTWAPVITDCKSGPEDVAGYAIMLLAIWIAGWYQCPVDGGGFGQCPIYAYSPRLEVAFTVGTQWDLLAAPVPPVGGVDIYEAVTVDTAGNRSDQPCDP